MQTLLLSFYISATWFWKRTHFFSIWKHIKKSYSLKHQAKLFRGTKRWSFGPTILEQWLPFSCSKNSIVSCSNSSCKRHHSWWSSPELSVPFHQKVSAGSAFLVKRGCVNASHSLDTAIKFMYYVKIIILRIVHWFICSFFFKKKIIICTMYNLSLKSYLKFFSF